MYPSLEKNEWESNFFSRNIYNLDFEKIGELNDVDFISMPVASLLCSRVPANRYGHIDSLIKIGFNLAEGEIRLSKSLDDKKIMSRFESIDVNIATPNDLKEALDCIDGLYQCSRFRKPWFTVEERDKFYQEWIKKAIFAEFDDCCLLVKLDEKIAGFATLKEKENALSIGLIGVNHHFRSKGIGKKLLNMVESYALEKGKSKILVSTQTSNKAALKLYTTNGYCIESSSYWFYKQV